MEVWIVVLLSVIPTAAIAGVSLYLVRQFMEQEQKRQQVKLKENARNTVLPVKLQAYERLVILLERIRLNNLVMRVTKPGMNAQYLQREMLKQIRGEFEHNLSQQLYVSETAWKLVVNAREQGIAIMNMVGEKVDHEESANKYTTLLLQLAATEDYNAVEIAVAHLRKEMNSIF